MGTYWIMKVCRFLDRTRDVFSGLDPEGDGGSIS